MAAIEALPLEMLMHITKYLDFRSAFSFGLASPSLMHSLKPHINSCLNRPENFHFLNRLYKNQRKRKRGVVPIYPCILTGDTVHKMARRIKWQLLNSASVDNPYFFIYDDVMARWDGGENVTFSLEGGVDFEESLDTLILSATVPCTTIYDYMYAYAVKNKFI